MTSVVGDLPNFNRSERPREEIPMAEFNLSAEKCQELEQTLLSRTQPQVDEAVKEYLFTLGLGMGASRREEQQQQSVPRKKRLAK